MSSLVRNKEGIGKGENRKEGKAREDWRKEEKDNSKV